MERGSSRGTDPSGGELLLPPFSNHLRNLIQESDWRCRYSGVVSIYAIASGTIEVSPVCGRKRLTRFRLSRATYRNSSRTFSVSSRVILTICSIIMPAAGDPNARVRYALCQSLGQLCDDFGVGPSFAIGWTDSSQGIIQSDYAATVLPPLVGLLGDAETRFVVSHCSILAAADTKSGYGHTPLLPLSTFIKAMYQSRCKPLSSHSSLPYSPFSKRPKCMLRNRLSTQSVRGSLVCVCNSQLIKYCSASIATAVGSAFAPYYRERAGARVETYRIRHNNEPLI